MVIDLPRSNRLGLVAVGAAVLVLLVLMNRQLFLDQVFTSGDIMWQNLPMRAFYQKALQNGQGVLWMPQMFCGYYALAEGQAGFLHPAHYLLYRFLPLTVAFNLEALIPYGAMLAGAFWLLRRERFPAPAALFGALAWAFCGSNLMHWGHINAIQVAAHLPFLLVAADMALLERGRRSLTCGVIGLSLLVASQILLGHPFYFWLNMVTLVAWIGWRLASPPELPEGGTWQPMHRLARLALVVVALLLSVLLGSVQLLPSQDMVADSGRRTTDFWFRMQMSAHPLNLVTTWSPLALKNQHVSPKLIGSKLELSPYNGLLATVLLAWALGRWRHWGLWRHLLIAAGIFGIVCLAISWGYFGYVYRPLSALPPMNRFRAPSRYIELAQAAWALFQAFSVADLLAIVARTQPRPSLRSIWAVWVPLALSLLTAGAVTLMEYSGMRTSFTRSLFSSVVDVWWGVLLAAVVTVLVVLTARGRVVAFYAVLGVLVWDLFTHWSTIYPASEIKPLAQHLQKVQAQLPPVAAHKRFMSGELKLDVLLLPDVELANGYVALYPRKRLPVMKTDGVSGVLPPGDARSLRLAGTHWTRRMLTATTADLTEWVPVTDPLPRARLVTRAVTSDNLARDLDGYDIARVALIDSPVTLSGGQASPGRARIVAEKNGVVTVDTDAPTRQFLVLAESYHNGWTVTQNGRTIKPVRAYGDYLGVVVDAERQRTVFRFEPESYRIGKLLSLIGAGLLLLFGMVVYWVPLPAGPNAKREAGNKPS